MQTHCIYQEYLNGLDKEETDTRKESWWIKISYWIKKIKKMSNYTGTHQVWPLPLSPVHTVRFWLDPSPSLPPSTYARTSWMAPNSLDIHNLVLEHTLNYIAVSNYIYKCFISWCLIIWSLHLINNSLTKGLNIFARVCYNTEIISSKNHIQVCASASELN